jgi:GT2 family glycosyltransferase
MMARPSFETERIARSEAKGDTAFRTTLSSGWAADTATCDISFVIISWNAREYLRECLQSIYAATTGLDIEVIIVDNASSDGSAEMVRKDFQDAKLLQNMANAGFAQANNQGIRASRGRYLCLVNSDVNISRDAVRNFLRYMDGNPDVGIAGPKALNGDGSRQTTCRTVPTLKTSFFRALSLDTLFPHSKFFGGHFMTNWSYDETREVDILGGCFWMIRRRALEKVGLLDTRFFMYGEDMDFCHRFHTAGWKVVFYPGAVITHYGGGSSGNAPARFWVEMQRANLQYWIKHRSRGAVGVYYFLLLIDHAVRVSGFAARYLLGVKNRQLAHTKFTKHLCGIQWLLSLPE